MLSGGCVLLTAMSAISFGRREARARLRDAIRMAAIFSAMDISTGLLKRSQLGRIRSIRYHSLGMDSFGRIGFSNCYFSRCSESSLLHALPIHHLYIIAVGGAGSLGSPALVSGSQIINRASRAITATPARYVG